MYRVMASCCLMLLLTACSPDWLPFSGGAVEGVLTAAPADWADVAAAEVIQLETRGPEPYSINLWVVGMGPALYLHAGANRATWVEHIESDANVRLQNLGKVYELKAERVVSEDEFRTFSDVYEAKYGNRPRNENVTEAYLFRLTAR